MGQEAGQGWNRNPGPILLILKHVIVCLEFRYPHRYLRFQALSGNARIPMQGAH
jgi:hypothetical protein